VGPIVNLFHTLSLINLERVERIELSHNPWQGPRLPLHHTRIVEKPCRYISTSWSGRYTEDRAVMVGGTLGSRTLSTTFVIVRISNPLPYHPAHVPLCNYTTIKVCCQFWSGWGDSNPSRSVWKTDMLPLTSHPQIFYAALLNTQSSLSAA
jgi:hypothetical protein